MILSIHASLLNGLRYGWLVFILLITPAQAEPFVSNVRGNQIAGTNLVEVYYDLSAPAHVQLDVSVDGGVTWTVPVVSVSQSVGPNVSAGTGKLILWAAGQDWGGNYSSNVRFRVTATDVSIPSGMVLIPGGTNSGTDPDFGAYSLTVDSFHMDRYGVTKALWDEVYTWAIGNGYSFDNAGSGKAANHPVHTVNWYDVVKWCNARSEREGRPAVYTVNGAVYRTGRSDNVVQSSAAGYRLPSDIEWEYAARGGLSGRRFPWGDTINHNHANYRANGSAYSYDTSPYTTWTYHPTYNTGGPPYTSPVGSFAANGYGLYDMSGNVWEWVFDWHPSYVGSYRVFRGGSWVIDAIYCRIGYRDFRRWPVTANSTIGFRAVLPPGQ